MRRTALLTLALSVAVWVVEPLLAGTAIQAQDGASFYGTVYDDRNRSGSYDAGDSPLGSVTVGLYDSVTGRVMATTMSGTDGGYSFFVNEVNVDPYNRGHGFSVYVTGSGGVAEPISPPMSNVLGFPAALWSTTVSGEADGFAAAPAPPYNFGFVTAGYGISYGSGITTSSGLTTSGGVTSANGVVSPYYQDQVLYQGPTVVYVDVPDPPTVIVVAPRQGPCDAPYRYNFAPGHYLRC